MREEYSSMKEKLIDDFMAKTTMTDVKGEPRGVRKMFEFLLDEKTVDKMIIASDMGLPVLTFVVTELEEKFD